jgi:UDP-N-acetylmuramate--alanine ligase
MLFKLKGIRKLHLVGIGGSGMSGLAEILLSMGFEISGSDIRKSEITERLEKLGCKIYYEHSPSNVKDKDLVIISSAIKEDNPEVREAKKLKIPVIKRLEMVAELTRTKYSICVSGAHGKGTVTSMIAKIIEKAKLSPTVMVGGIIKGTSSSILLGQSDLFVAEVDESDKYFLKIFPTIVVVTNIDKEHLDTYKNIREIKKAFKEFVLKVPFYGCIIINGEDKNLREIVKDVKRKVITFGFSKNFQIYPKNLNLKENYSTFEVEYNGEGAEIKINLPGKHNVLNALAAISTAYELEIPLWITKEALEEFKGLERRFEFKGERKGIGWLDDYAHHPTEIRETLLTAKNFWKKGRIVVIFQPHRYTRTYYLYKDFSKSLKIADIVLILPIYPAGEKKIKGVKSDLIYKEMKKNKKDVYLVKDEELDEKLKEILREGDLLVSIGAGDVWRKVKKIFENL